jgi:putative acyl-CoA dehydrogenase
MTDITTHDVLNQPQPLTAYNAFVGDRALREAIAVYGASDYADQLTRYGELAGSDIQTLGVDANDHPPRLLTHDRYGHRIDRVEFHPAYHRLMTLGIENGLTSLTWSERPGARVARSALMYLHNQFEAGTMCPMTMTHAAVPALRVDDGIAADWLPGILAGRYDHRLIPAADKAGLTIGMAMTEKQGGSDVRANTTTGHPLDAAGSGQAYILRGHKWFCSAPMSDAFLSLAQTDHGLTCFLVPRVLADGSHNSIRIQRLKSKLGNHANASSEIEYHDARALCLGEPGRGVATIIRMVAEPRLDCAIGSAALVRQAVAQALDHCRQRTAFGQPLIQQPLMTNVLADLVLESEAMLHFALHLAHRFERAPRDESSALIARIMTPIAKYWVCKRAVAVINEAQECLGGAGYVEEFILPRLYREAPVNAIWEGSGNIQCLDVLRAIGREPRVLEALNDWMADHAALPGMATRLARIRDQLADDQRLQGQARGLIEDMALVMQSAILNEAASPISEAFASSRLHGPHGYLLGSLPPRDDLSTLIDRAQPR